MSTARVKSAKAKKRSRASIAQSAAEKAARQAERDQRRAEKQAQWEADYPLRQQQWQRNYDDRLAHEKRRAGQRKIQEAGVEWLMGYETPAAQMFQRFVDIEEKAARELKRRYFVAGDPLNITGHTPVMSDKKRRKQDEADRLARGERKIVIPDPDSPNQNVMVSTLSHSLRRVKLKLHQEHGAEKFLADYEASTYSGLSSMGFDPRVDSSSKQTEGYVRAAEAQKRLNMAKAQIGERNYEIVFGVLILNINATKAHKAGARQHTIVQNDIDVAMNALSGFYDPARLERDPTWKAFKKIIDDGLAVIRAGVRDLNDPSIGRDRPKARRSVR
jgi:hypothetical protein